MYVPTNIMPHTREKREKRKKKSNKSRSPPLFNLNLTNPMSPKSSKAHQRMYYYCKKQEEEECTNILLFFTNLLYEIATTKAYDLLKRHNTSILSYILTKTTDGPIIMSYNEK